jgi:hypothetical protein
VGFYSALWNRCFGSGFERLHLTDVGGGMQRQIHRHCERQRSNPLRGKSKYGLLRRKRSSQ